MNYRRIFTLAIPLGLAVCISCQSNKGNSGADSDSLFVDTIVADSSSADSLSSEPAEDSNAPAGAFAKLIVDKNEIFLLKGGKIQSANSKVYGDWKICKDPSSGAKAYVLSLGCKNADGQDIFFIPEDNNAFWIWGGSDYCEIKSWDARVPYVEIESGEGQEFLNLTEIKEVVRVTWL